MQKPFDWPAEVPRPTDPAMVRGLLALARGMADDVRTLKAGSGLPADVLRTSNIGTDVQAYAAYLDTLAAVGSHAALLSAIGAQPSDADLTALAGLSGVQGDIIYRDASQWQRLAKGTASQVLTMNAGATAPEWAAASGGGGMPIEATTTADNTQEAEEVNLPGSITPDDVTYLEFILEDIRPEIDGDTLFLTLIDDTDTELTTGAYRRAGYVITADGTPTQSLFDDTQALFGSFGAISNSTSEFGASARVRMLSTQANPVKLFEVNFAQQLTTASQIQTGYYHFAVTASNAIKGCRVDSNNSGDMVQTGTLKVRAAT